MAKRRLRRSSRSSSSRKSVNVLGFQVSRTVVFLGAIAGFFVLLNYNSNTHQIGRVLGAATQAFTSSTVCWQGVGGARGYNIYYKESNQAKYAHSVRGLSAQTVCYKIDFLKKNTNYDYTVAAYDLSGREFSLSSPQRIIKPQ